MDGVFEAGSIRMGWAASSPALEANSQDPRELDQLLGFSFSFSLLFDELLFGPAERFGCSLAGRSFARLPGSAERFGCSLAGRSFEGASWFGRSLVAGGR